MPEANCFLDTNILLYAASTSPLDGQKRVVAQHLVATEDWGWSAQVAAEFFRAGTAPNKTFHLLADDVLALYRLWRAFPFVVSDYGLVMDAIALSQRYQTSYYDAQILAAAHRLGCTTLYSEDLNHGQRYGTVRVVNPFRRLA